ncbi:ATP phosphoribosyltransferase [Deltaproteobacteria bacterium PRO3]|nr:ATP phosphoribosyltransferase [Deltaproteobacteria bacterium PRO3]
MKKAPKIETPQLRFGFPKGSLQDSTFRLFHKAGYKISVGSRSYVPTVDDPELSGLLIRSQEMARYVEDEVLDAGMCGRDWVLENDSDVVEVCELKYSKQTNRPIRWVVAVPNDSTIQSIKQLKGKRIATELVGYTRRYLKKHGVTANVEFSWGATEVKPPVLADAIVELTETGSSLRANNLRILETILESVTVLIANKKAYKDPWKRQKIENIAMLLQGAILAEEKVGLKMNVPKKSLSTVLAKLPALNSPTISHLTNEEWVSVEVILNEQVVRDILPEIKRAGASGIVEYPLNKVIP